MAGRGGGVWSNRRCPARSTPRTALGERGTEQPSRAGPGSSSTLLHPHRLHRSTSSQPAPPQSPLNDTHPRPQPAPPCPRPGELPSPPRIVIRPLVRLSPAPPGPGTRTAPLLHATLHRRDDAPLAAEGQRFRGAAGGVSARSSRASTHGEDRRVCARGTGLCSRSCTCRRCAQRGSAGPVPASSDLLPLLAARQASAALHGLEDRH